MPNRTTVEWRGATLTLVDSVWSDIVMLTMLDKFTDEGSYAIRRDFCYVLAHISHVKGLNGWKPVDDTATPEQFRECFKGLMSQLDSRDEFYELVEMVSVFKGPRAGAMEKPDEALTEAEAADPN